MSEELDINAQYEQIFGETERPNIYSADDEEYKSLRQEILSAKREFNPAEKMPFDGVKLLPYDEYQRNEIVSHLMQVLSLAKRQLSESGGDDRGKT